mgnify:CR=1 FL=1
MGTRLVGSCASGKFVNGARYQIVAFSETGLLLQDHATQKEFEASAEQVGRCTLLAWAMVYNKAKGDTLQRMICLHDSNSKYMTPNHNFVGLSRVTQGDVLFRTLIIF